MGNNKICDMRTKQKRVERQKFASKVDKHLLDMMYSIASSEGKLFQTVLEEAMKLYVDSKKTGRSIKGKKDEQAVNKKY